LHQLYVSTVTFAEISFGIEQVTETARRPSSAVSPYVERPL
jgi:hypothetical protein